MNIGSYNQSYSAFRDWGSRPDIDDLALIELRPLDRIALEVERDPIALAAGLVRGVLEE
jgi:hypothetical protein